MHYVVGKEYFMSKLELYFGGANVFRFHIFLLDALKRLRTNFFAQKN